MLTDSSELLARSALRIGMEDSLSFWETFWEWKQICGGNEETNNDSRKYLMYEFGLERNMIALRKKKLLIEQ